MNKIIKEGDILKSMESSVDAYYCEQGIHAGYSIGNLKFKGENIKNTILGRD